MRRINSNKGYDSILIFILSRETLIPKLIFNLYYSFLFYPVLIESGSLEARFILIRTNNVAVIDMNSNSDIISWLDYSTNNNNLTYINNMRGFRIYDKDNAYYIANQYYASNLTDKYSTTTISKTNINLRSNSWDSIHLDESGII